MDILFLAHCVPNPPNKGERIRAYHELIQLAQTHRVHLACFAKSQLEIKRAHELDDPCASVFAELLPAGRGMARAGLSYLAGRCAMASLYDRPRMRRHVESLASRPLSATVVYSSVMAQYAPAGIPVILDMVDVDSEKWLQYGRMRRWGMVYRTEGERQRKMEAGAASQAACTLLSTWNEARLLRSIVPAAPVRSMENGVDFDYFDPALGGGRPCPGRRFLAFVGAMDYYPNADAVGWFASQVFTELRRRHEDLEFLIVGRNPTTAVRRLAAQPGITVTGAVADVRPYLSAAEVVIAPLRIARGIQNKVLEALAMGKPVLASTAVCDAFSPEIPAGVLPCRSAQDYLQFFDRGSRTSALAPDAIRGAARQRFSWSVNLQTLTGELETVACRQAPRSQAGGNRSNPAVLQLSSEGASIAAGGFRRAE